MYKFFLFADFWHLANLTPNSKVHLLRYISPSPVLTILLLVYDMSVSLILQPSIPSQGTHLGTHFSISISISMFISLQLRTWSHIYDWVFLCLLMIPLKHCNPHICLQGLVQEQRLLEQYSSSRNLESTRWDELRNWNMLFYSMVKMQMVFWKHFSFSLNEKSPWVTVSQELREGSEHRNFLDLVPWQCEAEQDGCAEDTDEEKENHTFKDKSR